VSNVTEIKEAEFDETVLRADELVMVDFWARGCRPCYMVAPVLDELAGDYNGTVRFVKVNIEENMTVAGKYGVRSIPTLMLFKDGQPVETIVGYKPKGQLKEDLDTALGKG